MHVIQVVLDAEASCLIRVLADFIFQNLAGNPVPSPGFKIFEDCLDSFGFPKNPVLREFINETTQAAGIQINFPELQIV